MNDQLIDKIRKLLRLGQSSNQHEAELAMQKAMELAQNHNIEISKISTEVPESTIEKESVSFGKRLPIVSDYIYSIITKFFNVEIILSGNRDFGRSIIFIGTQNNIAIAKHIFNFLSDAMDTAWKSFYSVHNVGLNDRKNFFLGFKNGLYNKLDRQKKEVETVNTSLAVMVVNNSAAIKKFISNEFTNLRKNTKPAKNHFATEAYNSGYKAGENTNLNSGLLN